MAKDEAEKQVRRDYLSFRAEKLKQIIEQEVAEPIDDMKVRFYKHKKNEEIPVFVQKKSHIFSKPSFKISKPKLFATVFKNRKDKKEEKLIFTKP